MQINEEYKKILCVKKMGEQYKEHFFKIVSFYAPKLPDKLLIDGSAYTLHDFNHHCINIFKIISDIILYPKSAFSEEGLSDKELYILNLAVLFHDIGMSAYINGGRKNHSRKSAEYIEEIYRQNDSTFRNESTLNENEIKALRLIVMAHSDLKDENILQSENGLNNPQLRDDMPAQVGVIRARFLASILRLADELDVTVERLGNGDIEFRLDAVKEQKLLNERRLSETPLDIEERRKIEKLLWEIEGYIESSEHWQRLHLFSNIYKENEDSDKICIKMNDDYITHCCDIGDTYEHLIDNALSVYRKIDKELKQGLICKIDESRNKLSLKQMISIETIKLVSDNESVNELIAKKLDCLNITSVESSNIENNLSRNGGELGDNELGSNDIQPYVIDEVYQEEFSKIVSRRHLIKVGHFLLDETYCARDWIDTKEIIETRVIVDKIITKITMHINTNFRNYSNYLIIGLDLEGAILASRVAMALQKPFSYLIPAKEIHNNADKDIEIAMEKYDNFIIITDAVVTFETIKKVISSICLDNSYEKILQIYTIFFRQSNMIDKGKNEKLIKKTACISSKFGVELFEKAKCPYKDENCFGLNRIIR